MSGPKLTDLICKKIIRKIAVKYGIEPRLIAERLLSDDDKQDLRDGNLLLEALDLHIRVWISNGLPDYCFRDISTPRCLNEGLNGIGEDNSKEI
jgi:hypothetical protein